MHQYQHPNTNTAEPSARVATTIANVSASSADILEHSNTIASV